MKLQIFERVTDTVKEENKKNSVKKLRLNKETIRQLRDSELRIVGGGTDGQSGTNICNPSRIRNSRCTC
jgi:hypothetical protein